MKKLILAVAVVAFATVVNAAQYNWKTAASNQIYNQNTTDKLASGMAYIFDSTALTQTALLEAFVGGSSLESFTSLDKSAVASGVVSAKTTESDYINAGATLSAYFAVINDAGDIYISDIVAADGKDVGSVTLSFKAKAASQLAAADASAGFSGAGWYTAAVPEPTSGLLLLLGMAGLALKRKQA